MCSIDRSIWKNISQTSVTKRMSEESKIILFGGTFDPIHNGHLIVARHALLCLGGDELIFVPARQSPHKKQAPTEGQHRLAMIRCAIASTEGFSVSDCELNRAEPSYTVETIRHFRQQAGEGAAIHWLIGADQLADLDKWYRIDELLSVCHISTMVRGGYPAPDMGRFEGVFGPDQIEQLRRDTVMTPEVPVCSTEIRQQLSQGRMPGELPACVADYIRRHKLYGFS
jgi:nicotinate-nucleotide adenylyltransferase